MNTLRLAWRMLRREARAGELRLLFSALFIAVAALSAVGFFTNRVQQALVQEANHLLGADMLLVADHPWSSSLEQRARSADLKFAKTQTFPSMVSLRGKPQLADVKAVTEGYPLRGALRIAAAPNLPDAEARAVPAPGQVWLDERLAAALEASVGEKLKLGEREFTVTSILTLEPDRGINFFSVAPRLMMNLADLEATGLIQVGSRVTYRLLLAGDEAALASFRKEISAGLGRGERIEDAENARPEIRSALERAQKFLGLAALLTVVQAAVAVALAARRYMQRHLDACAVMRCLGAQQAFLLRFHLIQFLLIALVATVLGCLLGYTAHFALHAALAHLLARALPQPSAWPALQGAVVGFLLLFGFALPPLLQLKRVSTLRVLRRELGAPQLGLLGGYTLGLLALAGLMLWVAGELRLGLFVLGGFLAALLLFAVLARIAIRLLSYLRGSGQFGWRYGLAGLERRAGASTVQIVALALGFMALLLLTVTRGELMQAWQHSAAPDAPNRFVINIQPEQREPVQAFLQAQGIATEMAPMVRGRLTRINDKEVSADTFQEEQARRLVEREFNLSWRASLPPGNRIVAGEWFGQGGGQLASVEEGLAKTLHLKLGDTLEFNMAGESVQLKVSSLRKLNWDSMRVNFFVVTPPGVLENFPQNYITSFYLENGKEQTVASLVREFPNLTVVDVGAILRQIRSVIDQVAQAIQFVFLFTVAAGFIVLYAALATAFDERKHELAVMRALGARSQQLRYALLAEFAVVGALAGFIAAIASQAVGYALASLVFQLELPINFALPIWIALLGAILVPLVGSFGLYRLMQIRPVDALRDAAL